MKRSDTGFKLLGLTLIGILITGLIYRFVYMTWVIAKTGQLYWYNRELWKQFWAWLPGQILSIIFVILIITLILEGVYFIFFEKKKCGSCNQS